MPKIAIIGGGPAGLRVAQLASNHPTWDVSLFEQKRSVGRKFLVAGKSGLNLTNNVGSKSFIAQYKGVSLDKKLWTQMYDEFSNEDLRAWAKDLGVDTFVSSGQKVFPLEMKAAPLLRAWVTRIKAQGCSIHVNNEWASMTQVEEGYRLAFKTPEGRREEVFDKVVLALGGGSWPQTGSTGAWVSILESFGLRVRPLISANCGWEVAWDNQWLATYEGEPMKNIVCKVGDEQIKGEVVVTKYGLEGGPIYKLGHALRQQDSPVLEIDFKPDFTVDQLIKKAESVRSNARNELLKRWKVSQAVLDLIHVFSEQAVTPDEIRELACLLKSYKIAFQNPRSIVEAISSAGGVDWSELDSTLMLKKYPNVYVCGEMLEWEAPTGGFLLQGCFSSATWLYRKGLC